MEANEASQEIRSINIEKTIINILQKCKSEAHNNTLQIPLEDIEDRVSYYTGISKIGLEKIQQKESTLKKTSSIDLNTHIIILKCLMEFYLRKELPTFRLLFKNIQELKKTFQDSDEFKQEATLSGFEYQSIFDDSKLLMEDPKITFERYSYLQKITKIRKKRTLIYYINERIIDKDMKFEILRKLNTKASATTGNEYTFFHAISRNGFTNGVFCLHPTEDDFYKWVVDVLLESLEPSSVVVLGNSPLHQTFKSNSISMYDTKCVMLKWLRNHNVPCNSAMHKFELIELVKKLPPTEEICRVDRIIKANGHEVLRLPPNLENFSPIEWIWQDIKRTMVFSTEIKHEIVSTIEGMHVDIFMQYENDIKEREKELFCLDTTMDNVLDNFLLNLKNLRPTAVV